MRTERWEVAPDTVSGHGEGAVRCLQIRRPGQAEWERLSDEIHGFASAPGYACIIDVAISDVADPPADGSTLRYDLVRVVERRPA